MAEGNRGDSASEQELLIINMIQSEREQIAQLLRSPLKEISKLEVFEKYFIADRALLEIMGQPEGRDLLLDEEPLPLLTQLQTEIKALEEELLLAAQQSMSKEPEKEKLKELIAKINVGKVEAPVDEANIGQIEENILRRFKLEKSRLKEVLSAIWPKDDESYNLIAKLMAHGVNNPEEYLTIHEGEGVSERICLLLKTKLFEANPLNAQEVRMVNLT